MNTERRDCCENHQKLTVRNAHLSHEWQELILKHGHSILATFTNSDHRGTTWH